MSKINLLPPQTKESINYAKRNTSLVSWFIAALIIFGALIFLMAFGLLLTFANLRSVREEVAKKQEEVEKISKIDIGTRKGVDVQEESEKIQRKISAIKTIERDQLFWSKVIEEVSVLTPDSIYLSALPLVEGGAKERLTLTGFATDQLQIAIFRDALDSSKFFRYVDIQSINVTSDGKLGGRRGYNFSINASISSYCLFSGLQNEEATRAQCDAQVGEG